MGIKEILILLAVAVPAVFILRAVLPKILLVSCKCQSTDRLWTSDVENYGLVLTEDSAEKRLRVGRVHDRLRAARSGGTGRRTLARRPR